MLEPEKKQYVQIQADKLIDAFLHSKQFEQHYATQESVSSLKEQMHARFEHVNDKFDQVNDRFEQVDKRLDEIKADNRITNSKLDRLQWFIVAGVLALFLKDYLFRLIGGV